MNPNVKFEELPESYYESVKEEADERNISNMIIDSDVNLDEAVPKLKDFWMDRWNKKYFKELKDFTTVDPYAEWIIWVSKRVRGHYHPEKENIVIVSCHGAELMQICEEIFHQHYWMIWGNRSEQPWMDEDVWKVSETVVEFFLDKFDFGFDVKEVRKQSYPFVPSLKEEIRPLFEKYKFPILLDKIKEELENEDLKVD